jgi:hypothetical protein
MFTPSPQAKSKQQVCGPKCRAKRDGKLQRARRRREIDDHRTDERDRQRASRARRREATCHAPPAESKHSKVQEKSEQIVARPPTMSRASLEQKLTEMMPILDQIVANLAPVTHDLTHPSIGYQKSFRPKSGRCHA